MEWFKSSKKTFEFPELERKLAYNRYKSKTESDKLRRKSSAILRRQEIMDKISIIRQRNKRRTILIVSKFGNDVSLVTELLQANSNALPTFVNDLSCAVNALKESPYDMVYLVVKTLDEAVLPCFFSMQEKDSCHDNHEVEEKLTIISPYLFGAEVIVVCDFETKEITL